MIQKRRSVPAWRVPDARPLRPAVALGALAVLAALLLEVWQCSTVASLSVEAGRANAALRRASAELEWTRAGLDRSSGRAEVGSLAVAAGVRPADPSQTVWLPAEYLEADEPAAAPAPPSLLADAGRALQALVPDATARSRHVN